MSATAPEHDQVNPFLARQPTPPVESDDAHDDAPPQDDTPRTGKTDAEKIQFAAKMAAGRAAKRLERQKAAAQPIKPDQPIAETERLRQKLANFLPDTTSLEIWKVIDGQPIWVGDYDARAVSSSKNVRHFILKNLYKKHKATTWEVVHVSADGKERAPYRLTMDPDAQGAEGESMSERMEALLREQGNKPSAVKEAIEALKNLKEMNANDEPQPPQPTTMVEYAMMRDLMRDREDPRVTALTRDIADIKAALSQPPPPMPMPAPPAADPMATALSLANVLMEPMKAQLAAQRDEMKAVRDEAAKREERILAEMKEARKSVASGGQGGLEDLRDKLKLLKEIEEQRGGGGTDITKLVTAVSGFLKDMKANDPNQQKAGDAAPAAGAGPLTFPPGTEAMAAKIAEAKDDNERVAALMTLYQHIMQSGDPLWLRFHSIIVEHAKKGETKEVREYVEGFTDAMKFIPEPARKAALAAFDAQADGIVKALAQS